MRRRSWPFAAALAVFVAVLGLLPHLRFGLLVGEPAPFFSAYDEDLYALWAFAGQGPLLPHRWLSSVVLVALSWACGGSWGLALILADVVFPVACAFLAWRLVALFTRRRLFRLLLALGLLFAQEFLSLGCWTIWQYQGGLGLASPDGPAYDVRYLRSVAPAWLVLVWPDYASPFLTLFRTPEPQMSRALLYAILMVLLEICRREAGRSRGVIAFGAVVNAALFTVYFFPAAGMVVLEGTLSVALAVRRRWWAALATGGLALVGGGSVLAGILAYHVGSDSQSRSFASHLPVLAPSSIAAVIGLLLLATVLRRARGGDALFPLAVACFGSVLVLTNQQVVTGRMISTRDWERSVDYTLVFLGATLTAVWLIRQARVRLHVLYAFAGAALLAGSVALLEAQDRVFEKEFLVANLKSLALERAVEKVESGGIRVARWWIEEPELDLQLQVRLERRISHLLDITEVFSRPLDPLEKPAGRWGPRSPFKREVFEYFARKPRTAASVARILRGEAGMGGSVFLPYLFALDDFWTPMTDGRRTRRAEVDAHVPELAQEFGEYLETADPCWSRPIVILTRDSLAERTHPRWAESFLGEVTVGRDAPLMNMHAYLQTLAVPLAPGSPQDVAGCD